MKSTSLPTRSGFPWSQYDSGAAELVPPPPDSHVASCSHSLIPSVRRYPIALKSGSSGGVKLVVSAVVWKRFSPRSQPWLPPRLHIGPNGLNPLAVGVVQGAAGGRFATAAFRLQTPTVSSQAPGYEGDRGRAGRAPPS